MPDVRSLLSDAASPPSLHPDPAGAVRARVRRRDARRRTTLAAVATLAVAAGGAVAVTRPGAGEHLAATPSASSTAGAADDIWHAWPNPYRGIDKSTGEVVYVDRDKAKAFDDVAALVAANPRALLSVIGGGHEDGGEIVSVALAADADADDWQSRVAAVAGTLRWSLVRCPRTAARYEAIATEVRAARWPSGATIDGPVRFVGIRRPAKDDVAARPDCGLHVVLSRAGAPASADVAYAATRWGADVTVDGTKAP
jgi:hypothetical protein